MKKFDDEEYFLLKTLSNAVISGVSPALEKITKQCERFVLEIDEIDKKLEAAESGAEINEYSKISEQKRTELIKLLAIRNRLKLLIFRNKSRVKYIDDILKNAGVYNESFDRKKIAEIEKQESENISENTLNLNVFEDGKETETKFFEGEIITLFDGKLDFSRDVNKKILAQADDEYLSKVIKNYPASMASVSVDMLANSVIKKRILKAIATYVYDETKKKDIKQVNKNLGNLLEFKTEITKSAEDYVAGVSNMFNAEVKKYMLDTQPEKADQIKDKLKCNEKSELIPESKRIAILAGGVVGNIAPEAEESEEMRIENEKEMQKVNSANALGAEIFEAQENQEEIDILAEIDKLEEIAKKEAEEQEREQINKQKQAEEQELAEKQAEQEMERMLSKNKYDD